MARRLVRITVDGAPRTVRLPNLPSVPTPPASTRRSAMLAATRSPRSDVYIKRISSMQYDLLQPTNKGRYWQLTVDQPDGSTLPGGKTPAPFRMFRSYSVVPYLKTEHTASGNVVHTGTWASLSGGTYSGGSALRSEVTGDFVTFTTPQAATLVGIVAPLLSTGGLSKVEIDGDATAANLLPTAQQVVNAGTFPASILTTNGGTLAPTDRVYDAYNASTINFREVLFADDLPLAVHAVKVTITGFKRAASTGTRFFSDAYLTAAPSITPATPGVILWLEVRLRLNRAEYEFAYRMTAGGLTEWAGGFAHGYEQLQGSLAVTIDGSPASLTDGQTVAATTVRLAQTTHLFHPGVDAGNVPTCVVNYVSTLNQDGYKVEHSGTWQTAMTSNTAYPAMMSTESGVGNVNIAQASSDWTFGGSDVTAADVSLTTNQGSFKTVGRGSVIAIWEGAGKWAALMSADLPASVMFADYAFQDADQHFIWNKDANTKKAYFTRQGADKTPRETVVSGTVWQSAATYRFCRLDDPGAVLGTTA